ncbi:MAG: hypothetical protein WBZ51_14325, partial [Xanthobacteraceae bacterium]
MEIKLTDLILRRRTDLGFTRDRPIKYAMLPSTPARGFRPTSGRSTRWRDAEDHFDAVVIDLNPADDGM